MTNDPLFQMTGQASSLRDLFAKSKEVAADSINVATLGIVTEITREFSDRYGIALVKPIPARDRDAEGVFEGYFFADGYATGDIILAVFTDSDFRPALKTAIWQAAYNSNKQKHRKAFAVLINLSGGSSSNES